MVIIKCICIVDHSPSPLSEPTKVQTLTANALSSSAIRVRWSSPECPYGVITNYRVFYRQADTPQTGDIDSTGYTAMTVGSSVEEYVISGLTPFKNYTIHVQAVNGVSGRGVVLLGAIEEEILERTLSDVETPPMTESSTNSVTMTVPPSGSTDSEIPITTIIIAICVVVVVAMVLITIIVIYVVRSRHSSLDLNKDLR